MGIAVYMAGIARAPMPSRCARVAGFSAKTRAARSHHSERLDQVTSPGAVGGSATNSDDKNSKCGHIYTKYEKTSSVTALRVGCTTPFLPGKTTFADSLPASQTSALHLRQRPSATRMLDAVGNRFRRLP